MSAAEKKCSNAIFEHSNSIILSVDSEGNILSVNPFTLKLFQYKKNELIGKSFSAFFNKGGVTENKKKNGQIVYTAWSSFTEKQKDNTHIVYYIGNVVDETNNSSNRFPALFNNMQCAVLFCKGLQNSSGSIVDFQILESNPASEAAFQLSHAEITEKFLSTLFLNRSGKDNHLGLFVDSALTGKSYDRIEFWGAQKKWFNLKIFSPEKYYVAVILYDVTAVKESEKALSELLEAQKLAKFGTWRYSYHSGVLNCSEGMCQMLGILPESKKSALEEIMKRINPADVEKFKHSLPQILETKGKFEMEFRLANTDETESIYFLRYSVSQDEYDNSLILSGSVKDITDQKNSEMEREKLVIKMQELFEDERLAKERTAMAFAIAEQTRQELEISNIQLSETLKKSEENIHLSRELLAVIAHEIRTPISGIIGFSDLLSNEIKDADIPAGLKEKFSIVNFIKAAAKKLSELLDGLLELSSFRSGKNTIIRLEECSIKKIIDDVYTLLHDRFENQNTTFHYHINCEDTIKTDPLRFQQIIMNLVNNAVKFTHNGKVEIFVKKERDTFLFKVVDNGIGIEEEYFSKIFNIFEQLDVLRNVKYRGVGIGLSICKQFVEILGGKISVDSEPGKGSCFTFILPQGAGTKIKTPKSFKEIESSKKDSSSLEILFAEDDEINHVYIRRIFQSFHPKKCKGVYNGREFLKEIESHCNYNFIFLDIQLPEIDGIECLKSVKMRYPDIPVVAVTAYALNGDRDKFLGLGFDGFIGKPVTKTDIIAVISMLTKKFDFIQKN